MQSINILIVSINNILSVLNMSAKKVIASKSSNPIGSKKAVSSVKNVIVAKKVLDTAEEDGEKKVILPSFGNAKKHPMQSISMKWMVDVTWSNVAEQTETDEQTLEDIFCGVFCSCKGGRRGMVYPMPYTEIDADNEFKGLPEEDKLYVGPSIKDKILYRLDPTRSDKLGSKPPGTNEDCAYLGFYPLRSIRLVEDSKKSTGRLWCPTLEELATLLPEVPAEDPRYRFYGMLREHRLWYVTTIKIENTQEYTLPNFRDWRHDCEPELDDDEEEEEEEASADDEDYVTEQKGSKSAAPVRPKSERLTAKQLADKAKEYAADQLDVKESLAILMSGSTESVEAMKKMVKVLEGIRDNLECLTTVLNKGTASEPRITYLGEETVLSSYFPNKEEEQRLGITSSWSEKRALMNWGESLNRTDNSKVVQRAASRTSEKPDDAKEIN